MKKILLLIMPLMAVAFLAQAQLSYTLTADTTYLSLPGDSVKYKAKFTITNNSTTDSAQFEWKMLDYAVPSDWLGANQGVCDWNTCIPFGNTNWHTPDKIAPTQSKEMYVELGRNATSSQGCAAVEIEYREAGQVSSISTLRHTSFSSTAGCFPLSISDFNTKELVTVYPNPATDFINITVNDSRVKSVQLSNIIGRQIKRVNIMDSRSRDQQISLAGLPDGLYILQYKSAAGKVLGVHRITKR